MRDSALAGHAFDEGHVFREPLGITRQIRQLPVQDRQPFLKSLPGISLGVFIEVWLGSYSARQLDVSRGSLQRQRRPWMVMAADARNQFRGKVPVCQQPAPDA